MTTAIQSCPPPNNPCAVLLAAINDFINRNKWDLGGGLHGLKHRFPEQINGANGPGSVSWNNHEGEIKKCKKDYKKD